MPVLGFHTRDVRAVQSGILRHKLLHSRKSCIPHARVGNTLRLFADFKTRDSRRIGVADCKSVQTITVIPRRCEINGQRCGSQELAQLVNKSIINPEHHMPEGGDPSVWFTATYGLPMQIPGGALNPFKGEMIEWGELTETGAFSG